MSNYSVGKNYEDFVETVYRAILEAEKRDGRIDHVALERRKTIISKSRTPSEIDIYWEYTLAGITNSVAIECKKFNRNVTISSVRDFARKISDTSGLKGLMVANKGFSKNAILEATADNIDLLVVREQVDDDWDGRIKTINIQMHYVSPCRTLGILPIFNKKWAIDNGFKNGENIQLNLRNDVLVFEDKSDGFKQSLYDLEANGFYEATEPGKHKWERQFKDGWMQAEDQAFKIDSVVVEYIKPKMTDSSLTIDFESYVLAIMEYINGEQKKYVILKTGERKEY